MDDLISRQAAIDAVCMEWCGVKHQDCEHPFDDEKDDYYWCDGCETVLCTLPDLPSAQQERIRWNFIGYNQFQCPKCGAIYTATQMEAIKIYDDGPELSNFCPNCGADMREGQDED